VVKKKTSGKRHKNKPKLWARTFPTEPYKMLLGVCWFALLADSDHVASFEIEIYKIGKAVAE